MLKVSKQGIKTSVVITLLISIFDYSDGEEVGFSSVLVKFFALLVVYEGIGFIEKLLKSRFGK
ncbi:MULTISPECIES: hypothetical protein [unclassified Halomonas]|uniref:hypothetical protein n=1 Tax=unclassified Halomonas TaxID=2609666 RepID=UPI00094547C4|nr:MULTISPECIES: hypothetical protein [unclassified Halomonas]